MKSGEEGLSYFYPEDLLPELWKTFRYTRRKTQEVVKKPDFGITLEAGFKVESAEDEINVVFYLRKKNTDKPIFADAKKIADQMQGTKKTVDNSYYLCYEVILNNEAKILKVAGYVVLISDWQSFVFPNGKQVDNTPENRYKKIGLSNGDLSGELPEVSSIEFLDFYFRDLTPPEAIPNPTPAKKDWEA